MLWSSPHEGFIGGGTRGRSVETNNRVRNNEIPTSLNGGINSIEKPRLGELLRHQQGRRDNWWYSEFQVMRMSWITIQDTEKRRKSRTQCWDELLDIYRKEWDRAGIDPQEGKCY